MTVFRAIFKAERSWPGQDGFKMHLTVFPLPQFQKSNFRFSKITTRDRCSCTLWKSIPSCKNSEIHSLLLHNSIYLN